MRWGCKGNGIVTMIRDARKVHDTQVPLLLKCTGHCSRKISTGLLFAASLSLDFPGAIILPFLGESHWDFSREEDFHLTLFVYLIEMRYVISTPPQPTPKAPVSNLVFTPRVSSRVVVLSCHSLFYSFFIGGLFSTNCI